MKALQDFFHHIFFLYFHFYSSLNMNHAKKIVSLIPFFTVYVAVVFVNLLKECAKECSNIKMLINFIIELFLEFVKVSL